MTFRHKTQQSLALLLLCLSGFTPLSFAAAPSDHPDHPDHWVGTWGASPLAMLNPDGKIIAPDTSLREIVRISLGGPQVRVIFSNELGLDPLTIGAANIALSTGSSEIGAATALTFGGSSSVTIPAGALMFSDPIALKLPAFADVAISLYLPEQPMRVVSLHQLALQTSYAATGNVIAQPKLEAAREIYTWPFVKGIDVKLGADAAAIVTIGDSITDGANRRRKEHA
jgi:hypothetical protein